MEALEGVGVGELKDLSQQIVKGKRTKRLRISFPTPFAIGSSRLSNYEGVEYSRNEENVTVENNRNNDNNNDNQNISTNLRLSPAGSSDDDNSTTTEELEIARLLILLSQGNPRESSTQNDCLDHNYYLPSTKFTSKKYIQTHSNGDGKSGMFVYECKTCNRTFSSFQALGGHRASHKKPRNLAIHEIKKRPISSVFMDDYDYDFDPSSLSLARKNSHSNLTSPISYHSMMNKTATSPKIHECSYCGAEFTSGQALGGHMRRHRGSNGNNNKSKYSFYNNLNNNISNIRPLLALSPSFSSPLSINQDFVGVKKQKINNDNKDALSLSLSLDLNLPAPPPAENGQKNQESTKLECVKEKISSPSPHKRNELQTDDNERALLLAPSPQEQSEQQTDDNDPALLLAPSPEKRNEQQIDDNDPTLVCSTSRAIVVFHN